MVLIRENEKTKAIEVYALQTLARHFGAAKLKRYDASDPIADLDGRMTMENGDTVFVEVKSSMLRGEAALNDRKLGKLQAAMEDGKAVFAVCGTVGGPVWWLDMADWPTPGATRAVLHDPRQQTRLDTERGWRVPVEEMAMVRDNAS